MRTLPLLLSVTLVVGALVACGSSSSGGGGSACTPGQSVACVGVGGCSGGQVCATDGSGYGACSCGGSSDGGGAVDGGGGGGGNGDGGGASGTDAGDASMPSTTGKACTTDAQCTGPGEKCSNDSFGADPILPSPVCVSTGCMPSATAPSCGGGLGACANTSAHTAVCSGQCTFDATSGAAPVGCTGKDRCHYAGHTGTAPVVGVGACLGGCTSNGDCSSGQCQVETGECVATAVTYAKALGQACTAGDKTCNCSVAQGGLAGMCTTFCITGSAVPCSTGFACDPGLPLTSPAFTTLPAGMAGQCNKTCTTDLDCVNAACVPWQGVTKICRQ